MAPSSFGSSLSEPPQLLTPTKPNNENKIANQISWAEGLRETIAWYRDPVNVGRWGNIEGALVAHPSHSHHPV